MPVPFTPRDLNSIIWYTASERYVSFHPGSTDRVSKLQSVTNGDWPLTGFDHQETGLEPLYRSPRLTALGSNSLNGRPTLSFPQGSYLKGATRAWTGPWFPPDPGTPWDFYSDPEGEASYNYGATERYLEKAFPPQANSGFILLRASPPAINPLDPFWTSGGTTSSLDVDYNDRPCRPCLFGAKLGSRFSVGGFPGCRILTWDHTDLTKPGTLEFYGSATAFVEPGRYDERPASATNFAAAVPFDRWGQWTLIDWRKSFTGDLNTIGFEGTTTFWINGVEVAQVDSPDTSIRDGYDFHLFGSSINTGSFGDTRTTTASGNVAEAILLPTALSDDDMAKARAWVCRKWGVQALLRGQPYASAPFIPGSDPQLDWAFPGIRPSARTYTPGSYANTPFESIGGIEQRVRHSSTHFVGDRLTLAYNALSEAEVGTFLAHYASMQGGQLTFGLHPEALVNLGPVARHLNRERSRAEYAPRRSSWSYASEPTIQNLQRDLNTITLELELQAEPFFIEIPTGQHTVEAVTDLEFVIDRAIDTDQQRLVQITSDANVSTQLVLTSDATVQLLSDLTFDEGNQILPEQEAPAHVQIDTNAVLSLNQLFDGTAASTQVSSEALMLRSRFIPATSGVIQTASDWILKEGAQLLPEDDEPIVLTVQVEGFMLVGRMTAGESAEVQVDGQGDLEQP